MHFGCSQLTHRTSVFTFFGPSPPKHSKSQLQDANVASHYIHPQQYHLVAAETVVIPMNSVVLYLGERSSGEDIQSDMGLGCKSHVVEIQLFSGETIQAEAGGQTTGNDESISEVSISGCE